MNWLIENWSIIWLYTVMTIFVLGMVVLFGRVVYQDWMMQREIRSVNFNLFHHPFVHYQLMNFYKV